MIIELKNYNNSLKIINLEIVSLRLLYLGTGIIILKL